MFVAAPESSGGSGLLPMLLLFGLLALMYFMVIRPQSQRRKQMQRMQESVAVGAPVVTIGGLYGTVVGLDDESITLEVAPGVTNRYARGAIAKILPDAETASDTSGVDEADSAEDAASEPDAPAGGEAGKAR